MTDGQLQSSDLEAIAAAVADQLRAIMSLPGWPEGRGTINEPEAAHFLSIGTDFLRKLRLEGRIAHRKIGRRVVYAAADISEFLATCGIVPAPHQVQSGTINSSGESN